MAPFTGVHLHHIARETTDVQRLAQFYEEVLGFQRMDTPNFGNFDVIWLTLPNSFSLHLIQRDPGSNLPESPFNAGPDTEKDPNHIQRGHHISFGVSDYEDCVTTLKEKGIPIYEKTQQGGKIKQAFFFDPDGNGLELGSWPKPH